MRPLFWLVLLLAMDVVAVRLGHMTGALTAMTGAAIALAILLTRSRSTVKELREQATTDALTGLANYRKLIDALEWEIARSGRTHGLFSVLFVDMDGLKRINDRHGHVVGSWALCRLAEALRRSCRAVDTPARFGGDEFTIILPETSDAGAEQLATRLRAHLAEDVRTPSLSISTGIAEFPRDGLTPVALLGAAGRDLGERKRRRLESGVVDRPASDLHEHAHAPASALAARFEQTGRTSKPS